MQSWERCYNTKILSNLILEGDWRTNDARYLYPEEKLSIFAETTVMKLIQRNIAQIVALCEKHKVESLYVFGSVLTDRFNDESDIDFVVVFDKAKVEDYFDNYFDFKYALEELFNRSVDLVEDQTIKNIYLRQNVDASKQLIYG